MLTRSLARLFPLALLLCATPALAGDPSLAELRKGHKTKIVVTKKDAEAAPKPEAPFLKLVKYPGPLGEMAAWMSVPGHEGHKHPAIVWVTGGFPSGGIGSSAWERSDYDNDQSAKSYRYNDMIVMYPWLRGDGGNPGKQEGFYGEVDDVIAAAKFLAKQPGVDPKRIYLGGHSTGGTLALLVAGMNAFPFKGVFAFGPADDPFGYGPETVYHDPKDAREIKLRAPLTIVNAIDVPTVVIEGAGGNADSLESLRKASKNPKLTFAKIEGADHFSVLRPINDAIAKVLGKLGEKDALPFTEASLQQAFSGAIRARAEASDIQTLARVRSAGVELRKPQTVRWYLLSRGKMLIKAGEAAAKAKGFTTGEIESHKDRNGKPYFLVRIKKTITLTKLAELLDASATARAIVKEQGLIYDGWDVE